MTQFGPKLYMVSGLQFQLANGRGGVSPFYEPAKTLCVDVLRIHSPKLPKIPPSFDVSR